MSGALTLPVWLDYISHFYLDDYIRVGGSSVKFVVCYPSVAPAEAESGLLAAARSRAYLTASVSAASTKAHLIEKVFSCIANQLPWQDLLDRVLLGFAKDNHWVIPDKITSAGIVHQLNLVNGIGEQQITLIMQKQITDGILRDRLLAKDFRVAMMWLANARLTGGPEQDVTFAKICNWLGGRINAISEMYTFQIFTKVNQANARHLLGSLLKWISMAGYSGLVVILDANRLLENSEPPDESLYYTKAALLEVYEVLRQFVDATDELPCLLLTVLVSPLFLDLDAGGRGLGRYRALMTRVYDEIRDRHLANPLTALVRLSNTERVVA